ncbi:MAG: hypothetical protein ABFR50_07495, partial [Candidatus Fermentibacteria bacterium]
MIRFCKRIPGRLLFIILSPLLFIPLLFLRTSPGSLNFPEVSACLGAVFFYHMLSRLISRLHLTSVLISLVVFSIIVFGLALYLQPPASEVQSNTEETVNTEGLLSRSLIPVHDDSSESSGWTGIQSEIDSLATSGGEAIRNLGLFDGSGTVGMTLGALGEVTSATAEIFIRTVYAGSNVAQEDSIVLSEGALRESEHPLKILALIAAVIFSIAILVSLKYLVLIERRKGTLLWFQLLVIIFVLRILYVSLGLEDLFRIAMAGISSSDIILSISPFYVLLFIFAFINSFKTDWAHYLTRWKKYLVLAGSLGVLVLSQSIL